MSKELILNLMGWTSFILFLIMQIPQILLMIKTKSTKGVAVLTWIIYSIALFMSGIYLYLFNENNPPYPVILNQLVSGVLSLYQVILYFYYKRKEKLS